MEALSDEVKRILWNLVKDKANVVGFSGTIMPKIKDGQITDIPSFRIYVKKKVPKELLAKGDLIPSMLKLGSLSFPTDVVEIGIPRSLSFRDRIRPVVAGISAMGYWEGSTACTLGFFAKNKKRGEEEFIGVICNNHCGARSNKCERGTPYLQPSPLDGGLIPRDQIGILWRYVPIYFSNYNCQIREALHKIFGFLLGSRDNTVDICLIKLLVDFEIEIYEIGKVYGKRRPVLGEHVQKMGRTTGHTVCGKVIDLDWNGRVLYDRGTAFFKDTCLIEGRDFSLGGDSSSPINSTTRNSELLGILFAGSETHTIACYIDNIEKELEVEIYPFK